MRCFATCLSAFCLFLSFLFSQSLQAQHSHPHHPGCSFDHRNEKLLEKFPELRKEWQHYRQRVLPQIQEDAKAKARSTNTINVPIVVHIVHNGEAIGTGANLSDARIQAQIDVLNEDFSATNDSYNDTPTRWRSVIDNPNIQFCLASIDPNGNPTNGIVRTQMTVTGTDTDDTNIESDIKPAIAWNPSRYYNLYVLGIPGTTAGGGVTGYAYLPYSGTIGNSSFDGSVVDYRWFGGPGFGQSGYKTLTHETGHYLGLFHTFNGSSCSDDDGIADTPNIGAPTSDSGWFSCNSGYPAGPSSCGNEHMYVNYMDYTSSSCYTSFTAGQVSVMRAVLDGTAGTFGFGSRAALAGSSATACAFVDNDAAVTAINEPGTQICGSGDITPQVVVTNFGNNALQSVTIQYRIDGGNPVSTNWTGNLVTGGTATVDLTPFSRPSGSFTFQAYATLPNGVADQQPSNDSLSVQSSSVTFDNLPFAEDFEQAAFNPTTNGLRSLNVGDDNYAWERINMVSANTGTASAMMDNYDANNDIFGTLDGLLSPTYDFSNVTGAELRFYHAYARYTDGAQTLEDSLIVLVSVNCGSLFDQIIYRDGGSGLETGSATANPYVPSASEWRENVIDLSNYDNVDNVTIALVNKSGWGNRLYLDDIRITTNNNTCNGFGLSASKTDVSCFNGQNGQASVTVDNGVGPYTVAWSNGANQLQVNNLTAGTYGVTVTDSRACSASESVQIDQPSDINFDLQAQNATSNSSNDGSISTTASGGTPPYTYSWNTGATTANLSNLAAGTYEVTITDANQCTKDSRIEVGVSVDCSNLDVAIQSSNLRCNGDQSGSIQIDPRGGTAPYTYRWSNGATTTLVQGLPAGTFTVTVTDANSCTSVASSTLSEPSPLSLQLSKTNESTQGQSDGTASATPSGGTAPYSYSWSNGGSTAQLTGLAPGVYVLTLTDANDCRTINEVRVEAGGVDCSNLDVAIQGSNLRCNGDQSGSIQIDPRGGTAPYSYRWSNGASTTFIQGLPAGTFTVTVTDANNCTSVASSTLNEPSPLSIQLSKTNESTQGQSDGTASATPSGGTAPYSYSWSNGGSTAQLTGLAPGIYTLTVTDANDCRTINEVQVEAGGVDCSNLDVAIQGSNLNCNGNQSGSIQIDPRGGRAPYTYRWSNGATTTFIQGLPAGAYRVTVTDANNCSFVASTTLSQPSPLSVQLSKTNESVQGQSDGTVNATPSGGTTPYSYSWSNGGSTAQLTGLAPGIYTLTVTDANDCLAINEIQIETGSADCSNFSVQLFGEDLNCHGDRDGSLSASITAGEAPYTYRWSNGGNAAQIDNLGAGLYSLTLTDARGCEAVGEFSIEQPDALLLVLTPTDDTMENGDNGKATSSVEGGTPPYSYNWSNGMQTADIETLAAGIYSLTVTDAKGCVVEEEVVISTNVATCDNFEISISKEDPLCFGSADGIVSVDPSGGEMPYTYRWSNGVGVSDQINRTAGTYSVTVTDANGCTKTGSIELTQPPALTLALDGKDGVCGVKASVSASVGGGTPPYSYLWSNDRIEEEIANLDAGTYSVTVSDANQCTLTASTDVIIDDRGLETESEMVDATCNGASDGRIEVSVTQGTAPFIYEWNTGDTSAMIDNLSPGDYTLSLTDDNGCTSFSVYRISEPTALEVSFNTAEPGPPFYDNGSLIAQVDGGVTPYSYAWSNGETSSQISQLEPGTYRLTVTDGNDCEILATVDLDRLSTSVAEPDYLTNWLVYPNPVAEQLLIEAAFSQSEEMELSMYNLLGKQLFVRRFNTSDLQEEIDMSALPAGAYLLRLQTDSGELTSRVIKL